MVEKIKDILRKYQERIPIIVMAEILSVMDEEEVCEYKVHIMPFGGNLYSSGCGCGTRFRLEEIAFYNFCPICGKKIKISEVE